MSVKFGNQAMFEVHSTQGDKLHYFDFINGAWHFVEYLTSGASWVLEYSSAIPSVSFPSCEVPPPSAFDQIFIIPPSADITQVWMIAFTLPLILWLTAWGFGVVINMFRDADKY